MAEIIGSLAELVKQPESKQFYYHVVDGDLVKSDEDKEASADLMLHLKFIRQRDYRSKLAEAAIETGRRKPLTKSGIKGIAASEGATHVKICEITLLGWRMNVRAAYALGAELDLSAQKATADIPYSIANRDLIAKHSNLAAHINALMTDHEEWFEGCSEEDSEKNSGSGANGSTAKSPVAPALKDH